MQETTQPREVDVALCRSGLYEALALGFRPPSQEMINRLLTQPHNLALTDIAAIVDEDSSNQESKSLAACVRKLMERPNARSVESLDCSFRFLFGHTAHSKVPPYETEYGAETLFQQPQQLSDLSGFFAAFGLTLNLGEHERVDHISCECEFLSFLSRKEAYALERKDAEMLDQTRRAQKLFLKDHIGRFAPSFANLLLREDPDGFYAALGALCHNFILCECARFGVPTGPENLRLRPKALVDSCFSCGAGDEVLQDMCGSNRDPD